MKDIRERSISLLESLFDVGYFTEDVDHPDRVLSFEEIYRHCVISIHMWVEEGEDLPDMPLECIVWLDNHPEVLAEYSRYAAM